MTAANNSPMANIRQLWVSNYIPLCLAAHMDIAFGVKGSLIFQRLSLHRAHPVDKGNSSISIGTLLSGDGHLCECLSLFQIIQYPRSITYSRIFALACKKVEPSRFPYLHPRRATGSSHN